MKKKKKKERKKEKGKNTKSFLDLRSEMILLILVKLDFFFVTFIKPGAS